MSEDFKVQASIKDYDGDMVNFRANSVDELRAEFAGFPYEEWASTKAQLKALAAIQPVLPGAEAQPAPQQGAWGGQQQPPAQQFNGPPAQGQVKTCAHGVRTYKTGKGRTGDWAGWFCALPKGTPGACEVEWVGNR